MAEEQKAAEEKEQPIIVKKIKKGGGHHGGAWKVAYADFVTAMMAFFLLLWLLNVSTDEELKAIAGYFDPTHPKVSDSVSGAGGVMGGLSMQTQGAMSDSRQPPVPPKQEERRASQTIKEKRVAKAKEALKKKEEERFKSAEDKIKQAIKENPKLSELSKNLMIDVTPEGLRIQIVDEDGNPMFASGSARMFDKTKDLISKISEVIHDLPNQISIRGHTDSIPYGPGADYTNWELSSDRANASRRVFLESGTPRERLHDVVGKADTEPLLADDPTNPRNRRISIILLKEELTNPDYEKMVEEEALSSEYDEDEDYIEEDEDIFNSIPNEVPVGTFRRTPGAVQFP